MSVRVPTVAAPKIAVFELKAVVDAKLAKKVRDSIENAYQAATKLRLDVGVRSDVIVHGYSLNLADAVLQKVVRRLGKLQDLMGKVEKTKIF